MEQKGKGQQELRQRATNLPEQNSSLLSPN